MAAPDFPASPSVGQIYTAPNGVAYSWDGTVWTNSAAAPGSTYWTDTGAELKPTAAGREVQVPGDTTNGASVILGPTTGPIRTRLQQHPTNLNAGLFHNRDWIGGNVQDDATKASWGLQFGAAGDNFNLQRSPAGTPGSQYSLLNIDNTGRVAVPGPMNTVAADRAPTVLGGNNDASHMRVGQLAGAAGWNGSYANCFWNGSAWAQEVAAQTGARMVMDTTGANTFRFEVMAATTGAASTPFYVATDGKTYCTLGPKTTVRAIAARALPANLTYGTLTTWQTLDGPWAITTQGGYQLFWVNQPFSILPATGGGPRVILYMSRGNTVAGGGAGVQINGASYGYQGVSGVIYMYPSVMFMDNQPAGTYNYYLNTYIFGTAGTLISTTADWTGIWGFVDLA